MGIHTVCDHGLIIPIMVHQASLTKQARLPAQSANKKIFTNMSMSIFCLVYSVSAVNIACTSQEHTLNESEKEQEKLEGKNYFVCRVRFYIYILVAKCPQKESKT